MMKRTLSLLLLLLSTSCAKETPRPDPPPDPAPVVTPAPVVAPKPSPSRLPVERRRREHVPRASHLFRDGERVRLEAKGRGGVWVYRDVQALEANDIAHAVKLEPGTYARIDGGYSWSGDLEVRIITGGNEGTEGSVRRADVLWLDGKVWRR